MPLPSILQGELRVRLVQGAVAGSLLAVVLGFGFCGWQFATNAERRAEVRVNAALVAALAPICVEKFERAAGVKATLVALMATDFGSGTASSRQAAGRPSPVRASRTAASRKPAPRS